MPRKGVILVKRKTGPAPAHDYRALWLQYIGDYLPKGVDQKDFCAQRKLNPTLIATRFAGFKREAELNLFKERNPGILLKAQEHVQKAFDNPDLDDKFKASFGLDALKAIADREGFSPQAATVQINNQNNQALILAPMFANPTEELRNLLGDADGQD